jgi:cobalt-zinc-cadmium efflux system outer membrane protein
MVTAAAIVLLGRGEVRAQDGALTSDLAPARELTVEDVLRVALVQSPDLGEARARAAAALARARQAARLPELQLKYEQWGVPLQRPWDLGGADALMVGVNQTLPAPRTLRARAEVAESESAVAALDERTRRRELAARVRRGFAEYYRIDRQLRLHQEHVAITARLIEVARGAYRSGTTSQQDVLRLTLELSRVHAELARMEPELRAARGLMNVLMNRPVDHPLGPPAELSAPAPRRRAGKFERTELAIAEKAIERAESSVSLAKASATWPSLMLGVDYMYMPFNAHVHGYGAMVAINLPWLSPGRRDEIELAEKTVLAERRALESMNNAVRFEILQAETQNEAARLSFEVIDRDLTTQAERNFEAAQASYAAGRGDGLNLLDALRTHLEVRVERVDALARWEMARADLARALGHEANQ